MYFLAIIIIAVIVLVGVVMYATFHDCDPLLTGKITNSNQVSRVPVKYQLALYIVKKTMFQGVCFLSDCSLFLCTV